MEKLLAIQSFETENCLNNKVGLSFGPAQSLPASHAHLRVTASPQSLCALRAVDLSVLLMRPEAELSPTSDTVVDSMPCPDMELPLSPGLGKLQFMDVFHRFPSGQQQPPVSTAGLVARATWEICHHSDCGNLYLQTSMKCNILPEKEDSPFALEVKTLPQICEGPKVHASFQISLNVSYKGNRPVSNMVIVDVKMISGFIPLKPTVKIVGEEDKKINNERSLKTVDCQEDIDDIVDLASVRQRIMMEKIIWLEMMMMIDDDDDDDDDDDNDNDNNEDMMMIHLILKVQMNLKVIQSQRKKNLLKNSRLLSTLMKWRIPKTKQKMQKATIK
uniref:Uncharacterized protein n=1 Tax=Rousettus aegyptiacus TaxID=9407 RepID=A0A7J8JHW2_ROUAE|nr:hypothetical protein HJG63_010306 [Rousettus aegyptiacus]